MTPVGSGDGHVVRPWKRYGHDRLYVQTADGRRLGYWDNVESTAVLEKGADPDAFTAAIAAYRGEPPTDLHIPAQAGPVDEPSLGVLDEAEPEQSVDLAATQPGAAARE